MSVKAKIDRACACDDIAASVLEPVHPRLPSLKGNTRRIRGTVYQNTISCSTSIGAVEREPPRAAVEVESGNKYFNQKIGCLLIKE